jgi:hypothetical protein
VNSTISYSPIPKGIESVPANFKPFNLEAALTGDPVVTRDGQVATQLVRFAVIDSQPVRAVVGGQVLGFRTDGTYYSAGTSRHDLFMAKKERTVYINILRDSGGRVYAGNTASNTPDAATATARNTGSVVLAAAVPVTFFE